MIKSDFEKFAIAQGIGSARLDQFGKELKAKGYINPMITEERQLNVAQMDVFSRLIADRIIFLGDEVTSDTANIITSQLMYLNSVSDDDIKLFINTPGGCISSGLMILDTMNFVKPDVSTYCMGMAASMGSVLLSAGEKGKRYILPHGEVLLHQPLGGTGYAQASDIEIMNKHIQRYKNTLYQILADNTGKSFDEIKSDCDRDNWLTAEQALEYGIVDEIIKNTRND